MSSNYLDLNKFRTSSAGTNVDSSSEELEVDMKYSALDWFFISFFGTTRVPQSISFKCLKTGERFEELTDKKLINYYMQFRRK